MSVLRQDRLLSVWGPVSFKAIYLECPGSVEMMLREHCFSQSCTFYVALIFCENCGIVFFGGETSRICELFIDVSPPFLRVEIEWGVL